MTIVVGYTDGTKVYMASDSQASCGWDMQQRKDPKVFIAKGILYGFTSSYRMGQILRFHTEPVPQLEAMDTYEYVVGFLVPMWRRALVDHGYLKVDSGREESGTFLIGLNGRLFRIESDFQVGEVDRSYDAIGCGAPYALGAMYMLNEGEMGDESQLSPYDFMHYAVTSANAFSNGCGGKVVQEEL